MQKTAEIMQTYDLFKKIYYSRVKQLHSKFLLISQQKVPFRNMCETKKGPESKIKRVWQMHKCHEL